MGNVHRRGEGPTVPGLPECSTGFWQVHFRRGNPRDQTESGGMENADEPSHCRSAGLRDPRVRGRKRFRVISRLEKCPLGLGGNPACRMRRDRLTSPVSLAEIGNILRVRGLTGFVGALDGFDVAAAEAEIDRYLSDHGEGIEFKLSGGSEGTVAEPKMDL